MSRKKQYAYGYRSKARKPNGLRRYLDKRSNLRTEELIELNNYSTWTLDSLAEGNFDKAYEVLSTRFPFFKRFRPQDIINRYRNTRGLDNRQRLIKPVIVKTLFPLSVIRSRHIDTNFLSAIVDLAVDYATMEVNHLRNKGTRKDRISPTKISQKRKRKSYGKEDLVKSFSKAWKEVQQSEDYIHLTMDDKAHLRALASRFDKIARGRLAAELQGKTNTPISPIARTINRVRLRIGD